MTHPMHITILQHLPRTRPPWSSAVGRDFQAFPPGYFQAWNYKRPLVHVFYTRTRETAGAPCRVLLRGWNAVAIFHYTLVKKALQTAHSAESRRQHDWRKCLRVSREHNPDASAILSLFVVIACNEATSCAIPEVSRPSPFNIRKLNSKASFRAGQPPPFKVTFTAARIIYTLRN